MKDLVIVESPTKAKEVAHILGDQFIVRASFGHIRDLPQKDMGVNLETFEPLYEPSDRGKKTIAQLKKIVREVRTVYLATDPDREGEAIAWHLKEVLRLKSDRTKRVTYQSLTESAVKAALKEAGEINYKRVKAQEARRVLDRLVGYVVSPELWKSGAQGLSAGRVQSVALRLVVERDREIRDHSKRNHFGAQLFFDETSPMFSAEWVTKSFADEDGLVLNRELAEHAAGVKTVEVESFDTKVVTKKPTAPFTTSTLQQEGNKKLNWSSAKTMQVAQKLFESGRITYMRTDSVEICDEALDNIRAFAESKGYPIPQTPQQHSGRTANAQEAHECVRPTEMFFEGEGLTGDEKDLYELIHQRTLVSQLASAKVREKTLVLRSLNEFEGKHFKFTEKEIEVTSPGYMDVTGKVEEKILPDLQVGEKLEVDRSKVLEKETKPPSHFTEGTLTAALEKRGIGRPATFASILENIKRRKYVTVQGKKLMATELGDKLVQILRPDSEKGCQFMEYEFTSRMEEQLDEIAIGNAHYKPMVSTAYKAILEDAAKVGELVGSVSLTSVGTDSIVAPKSGKKSTRRNKASVVRKAAGEQSALAKKTCPKCGKNLARRKGKHGPFWGCTGYPECRFIENEKSAKSTPSKEKSDKQCPNCGKGMILINGQYGKFYGCSGYPECKTIEKVTA
jgi:DNA topoisomerase-1